MSYFHSNLLRASFCQQWVFLLRLSVLSASGCRISCLSGRKAADQQRTDSNLEITEFPILLGRSKGSDGSGRRGGIRLRHQLQQCLLHCSARGEACLGKSGRNGGQNRRSERRSGRRETVYSALRAQVHPRGRVTPDLRASFLKSLRMRARSRPDLRARSSSRNSWYVVV